MITREQWYGGSAYRDSWDTSLSLWVPATARVVQVEPSVTSGAHDVVLPNVLDILESVGALWYVIVNRSPSATVTIPIKTAGGATLATLTQDELAIVHLVETTEDGDGVWIVDVQSRLYP